MRNYAIKNNVNSSKECSMKEELGAVLEKKLSFKKTSKKYQLPATTLKTRWKRMLQARGLDQVKFLQLGKCQPLFSENTGEEVVENIQIEDSFVDLPRNK